MKNLQELPKLSDSISYLYIEHAIIEQDNTAIVAIQKDGRIPIPIASMTCLLLGPGTSVTHAAIRAICENGCMAIWCGEGATRFYAAGTGETRSAQNLLHQAKVCMDEEMHMAAVRHKPRARGDEPKMSSNRRQSAGISPAHAGMNRIGRRRLRSPHRTRWRRGSGSAHPRAASP